MDDTLKNIFLGLCSFFVIRGTFEGQARHGAERQLREAFHETGHVHVRVQERGLFGYFSNDIYSVEAFGEGMAADRLPFEVTPRVGWKGRIRHLRLHLTDFTMKGLPVHRLDADVPDATFDLGHALYKDRLFLRSAGTGPATVEASAEGLRLFATAKYSSTLSDVKVELINGKVVLSGRIGLFGSPLPFTATGILIPRNGRFVDLMRPELTINGRPLPPKDAESLIRTLNPLLDIEADLGLTGFFTLDTIRVGEQYITLQGRMTVPLAKPTPPKP